MTIAIVQTIMKCPSCRTIETITMDPKIPGIFKISGIVVTVNLILNFLLIPTMGMQGAAIATLLSFLISMVLGYVFGRRLFLVPFPSKDFIKILVAAFFMGLFLFYLKDLKDWLPLAFQLASGFLIYLLFTLMLNIGGLNNHVIKYLKSKPASNTNL